MEDVVAKETARALQATFGGALSEAGELISDKIRFARWKRSLQIIEKAGQIAAKQDRNLSPPELKFLVPFLEKASLESESDNLGDKWANLLVAASDGKATNENLFVDILSKLKPAHARFLDVLVDGWPAHMIGDIARDDRYFSDKDIWDYANDRIVELSSTDLTSDPQAIAQTVFEDLLDRIEVPGRKMVSLFVEAKIGGGAGWELDQTVFDGLDYAKVSTGLEALGLVRRFEHFSWQYYDDQKVGGYSIGSAITLLGVEFMVACGFDLDRDAEEARIISGITLDSNVNNA